jgi:hypothetical protein
LSEACVSYLSLKSLQADHHARARDEAHAALERAEAEQRARLASERESRLGAAHERAHAEVQARRLEQSRAEADGQAEVLRAVEQEEKLRSERARSELTLRISELERSLQLSALKSQAARFRDRAIAWVSGAVCVIVIGGALALYYGKLRPERAALDGAQASALAAETRRASLSEDLLAQARRRADELTSQVSGLREQLRTLQQATAQASPPSRPGSHALVGKVPNHKAKGHCVDNGEPLDPCYNAR